MALRFRARPGRLLALALAGAAFAAALSGGVAVAEEAASVPLDTAQIQRLFEELQAAPVVEGSCRFCHANIANTSNFSSEIIFSHGQHIRMECASCHSRFPHRSEGTEKPTMKQCFNCHGVRHGPMGLIGADDCADCHVTPQERLRPTFHTFGWAGVEHVAPANKEFNTRCAMCHTPETCTECHDREGIEWAPASWDYDAGDGCLACHDSPTLLKASADGTKSFRVSGVSESAHLDLSCQKCHPDYRYDDKPAATPLWNVNAGKACAECHENQDDEALSKCVGEYNESIHADEIAKSNYDSATCASCHGGHYIYRLDTETAKQRMHMSSYRTCARCKQHGDAFDTYDDYYHGKAYKSGAPDAPACWDCHGSHKVLPKEDKESMVNAANIPATCGQEGCHSGTSEQFGVAAAELIHEKVKEQEANPLRRLLSRLTGN